MQQDQRPTSNSSSLFIQKRFRSERERLNSFLLPVRFLQLAICNSAACTVHLLARLLWALAGISRYCPQSLFRTFCICIPAPAFLHHTTHRQQVTVTVTCCSVVSDVNLDLILIKHFMHSFFIS